MGITRLQDVESGRERQVVMSDQAMSDAGNALQAHSRGLQQDCAGLGIRFTSCKSSQKWQQALLEHLRVRL